MFNYVYFLSDFLLLLLIYFFFSLNLKTFKNIFNSNYFWHRISYNLFDVKSWFFQKTHIHTFLLFFNFKIEMSVSFTSKVKVLTLTWDLTDYTDYNYYHALKFKNFFWKFFEKRLISSQKIVIIIIIMPGIFKIFYFFNT